MLGPGLIIGASIVDAGPLRGKGMKRELKQGGVGIDGIDTNQWAGRPMSRIDDGLTEAPWPQLDLFFGAQGELVIGCGKDPRLQGCRRTNLSKAIFHAA